MRLFGAVFYNTGKAVAQNSYLYKLKEVYPSSSDIRQFPNNIIKVSKLFSEIYNQAYAAEQSNLDLIAGMGYRKALEFLIKDYCIYVQPTKQADIESKLLGKCISAHITDDKIKESAKRAAWLGNDETHYVRKWQTKDIDDLKKLIDISVLCIDSELEYKNYLKTMP